MRKSELVKALLAMPGDPFIVFPAMWADQLENPIYYDVDSLLFTTVESRIAGDDTVYDAVVLQPEEEVESCDKCDGTGLANGFEDDPCDNCAGTGTVPL